MTRLQQDEVNVTQSNVGPLRWMAPVRRRCMLTFYQEALSSKHYSRKTDVYSFSMTIIEVLTRKMPYGEMDPLQVAIAVSRDGLRPSIPANCPADLADLLQQCWNHDPAKRPEFAQVFEQLENIEKNIHH